MTLMRFSAAWYRNQRMQAEIEKARASVERQRRENRRWRRKDPMRDPQPLLQFWDKNRKSRAETYSRLIIEFMSTFDGASEANQMMRHGLEAPEAQINLEEFEGLADRLFTLRLFELFAAQCGLSKYTQELVLQHLVQQSFAPPPAPRKPFGGIAEVPLSGTERPQRKTIRPEKRS